MKIKAIITGSTGMVGKGVLLQCLQDERIESVLVVNRQSLGMEHPKLKEIIHPDFFNLESLKDQLTGYNASFFCLGITSFRTSEADYSRIIYDLSLHFNKQLLALNPDLTLCFVSGAGTDSTETSKTMWARVKGKIENALLELDFKKAYMFRPGFILPQDGIKSRTKLYNLGMPLLKLLYPVFKVMVPSFVTTTRSVGSAMINAVDQGYEKPILESNDINLLANR